MISETQSLPTAGCISLLNNPASSLPASTSTWAWSPSSSSPSPPFGRDEHLSPRYTRRGSKSSVYYHGGYAYASTYASSNYSSDEHGTSLYSANMMCSSVSVSLQDVRFNPILTSDCVRGGGRYTGMRFGTFQRNKQPASAARHRARYFPSRQGTATASGHYGRDSSSCATSNQDGNACSARPPGTAIGRQPFEPAHGMAMAKVSPRDGDNDDDLGVAQHDTNGGASADVRTPPPTSGAATPAAQDSSPAPASTPMSQAPMIVSSTLIASTEKSAAMSTVQPMVPAMRVSALQLYPTTDDGVSSSVPKYQPFSHIYADPHFVLFLYITADEAAGPPTRTTSTHAPIGTRAVPPYITRTFYPPHAPVPKVPSFDPFPYPPPNPRYVSSKHDFFYYPVRSSSQTALAPPVPPLPWRIPRNPRFTYPDRARSYPPPAYYPIAHLPASLPGYVAPQGLVPGMLRGRDWQDVCHRVDHTWPIVYADQGRHWQAPPGWMSWSTYPCRGPPMPRLVYRPETPWGGGQVPMMGGPVADMDSAMDDAGKREDAMQCDFGSSDDSTTAKGQLGHDMDWSTQVHVTDGAAGDMNQDLAGDVECSDRDQDDEIDWSNMDQGHELDLSNTDQDDEVDLCNTDQEGKVKWSNLDQHDVVHQDTIRRLEIVDFVNNKTIDMWHDRSVAHGATQGDRSDNDNHDAVHDDDCGYTNEMEQDHDANEDGTPMTEYVVCTWGIDSNRVMNPGHSDEDSMDMEQDNEAEQGNTQDVEKGVHNNMEQGMAQEPLGASRTPIATWSTRMIQRKTQRKDTGALQDDMGSIGATGNLADEEQEAVDDEYQVDKQRVEQEMEQGHVARQDTLHVNEEANINYHKSDEGSNPGCSGEQLKGPSKGLRPCVLKQSNKKKRKAQRRAEAALQKLRRAVKQAAAALDAVNLGNLLGKSKVKRWRPMEAASAAVATAAAVIVQYLL